MIRLQKMYCVSMKYARIFHVLFGRCSSIPYPYAISLLKFVLISLFSIFTEDTHAISIYFNFHNILILVFIKKYNKKTRSSCHFNTDGAIG